MLDQKATSVFRFLSSREKIMRFSGANRRFWAVRVFCPKVKEFDRKEILPFPELKKLSQNYQETHRENKYGW